MSRRHLARLVSAPQEWDRRKLQVLLVLAGLLVAVVATGVVFSTRELIDGARSTTGHQGTGGVNDRPVATPGAGSAGGAGSLEAAQPGPLSTSATGTITLPAPARLGPGQVPTGLPGTPTGALAQLIAIDQRALQSASVVTAQDVITEWAAPGGPTATNWSGVQAITALLTDADLPADGSLDGSLDLGITLRPVMALPPVTSTPDAAERDASEPNSTQPDGSAPVEGQSGGPAMVCVDFLMTVSTGSVAPARIAVADCQNMVWQSGRWLIGPGPEPAPSPSVWPGTQDSYDAGYQWLQVSP